LSHELAEIKWIRVRFGRPVGRNHQNTEGKHERYFRQGSAHLASSAELVFDP
jgi:hypothetical protein